MAQPPAVVAWTSKPTGQLQLHRLAEGVRFYCVHCRQDKIGAVLATMRGDWAQTVCHGCYDSLVQSPCKGWKGRPRSSARAGEAAVEESQAQGRG